MSHDANTDDASRNEEKDERPPKWNMGILNDPLTHEVPGISCVTFRRIMRLLKHRFRSAAYWRAQ
jgi:hypothetical protein